MSNEILEHIKTQLFPYVECVDLRAFGESTLDRRLLPLVVLLSQQGIRVNLFTSLATHGPSYWESVGQLPLNLAISLEASSPMLYERIRGGARFDRFLRNLEAVQRSRIASPSPAEVYFTVVVSDENLLEIPSLVRLAAEYHIRVVRLNPITKQSPQAKYPIIGVSEKNRPVLYETLRTAAVDAEKLEIRLELAATLDCSGHAGFDLCLHPWSYVVIAYDGSVIFCDHLVADRRAVVGSVVNQDFMDIWNNELYQRLRNEHVEKDFLRFHREGIECDWCYCNRYADCEDILETSYRPLLLHPSLPTGAPDD